MDNGTENLHGSEASMYPRRSDDKTKGSANLKQDDDVVGDTTTRPKDEGAQEITKIAAMTMIMLALGIAIGTRSDEVWNKLLLAAGAIGAGTMGWGVCAFHSERMTKKQAEAKEKARLYNHRELERKSKQSLSEAGRREGTTDPDHQGKSDAQRMRRNERKKRHATMCYQCGEVGHIARVCLRRAAHRATRAEGETDNGPSREQGWRSQRPQGSRRNEGGAAGTWSTATAFATPAPAESEQTRKLRQLLGC